MNRTGLCSAHPSNPSDYAKFPRQMGGYDGVRSSQAEFAWRYSPEPMPTGTRWHAAVIAVLACICFAAIGVLMAWMG